HASIVHVVQAVSMQGVRKGWTCPKRQVKWCRKPPTGVRNEEVHECPGWIIEAHHIGSVLSGDVEVVVGTKRDSDWDVEIAAGVGKEVDERARRRVVASDAKISSERAARYIEVAVGAERNGRWRIQAARTDWITSGH